MNLDSHTHRHTHRRAHTETDGRELKVMYVMNKLQLLQPLAEGDGVCLCDNLAPCLIQLKSWNLSELFRDVTKFKKSVKEKLKVLINCRKRAATTQDYEFKKKRRDGKENMTS